MGTASGGTQDPQEEGGMPHSGPDFIEFKKYFHILGPVIRLMGIQAETPEMAFDEICSLPVAQRPSITVEDARKAHFAQRGWILYKHSKSDLVHDALHHIREGRFDEAEQILVGHIDDATIIRQIKRFERCAPFQKVASMAEKALKAHMQERRQESVPYTLALTDRLVLETYLDHNHKGGETPRRTTQARAWDTFSEQTVGLKELRDYMSVGRRKDPTTTPEGMIDTIVQLMGEPYTDALTAAKAWAALFSAGEWALQLERNRTET